MDDLKANRDLALKKAQGFAKAGNFSMTQYWLDRASQFWLVTDMQVGRLHRLLDKASGEPGTFCLVRQER